MNTVNQVVRGLLAHHLKREPASIKASQHLGRDLDVTPLELVLIALDLEDIEGVAVPIEQLGELETVGDLVNFLGVTVAEQRKGRLRVA
jgi:acyl carrier protein